MTILNKKNKKPAKLLRVRTALISSLTLLAFIYCILGMMFCTGCKTKEVIRYVPLIQKHDSIVYQTKHDTLLKYLPQKQSVIAVKNSHLETDLAISTACIDSLGLLHHTIENKGVIPGKVIDTKTTVHDSIPVPYPVNVPGKEVKVEVEVPVHDWIWYVGFITIILGIGYRLFRIWKIPFVSTLIKRLLKIN